jgi:hypothetical protein
MALHHEKCRQCQTASKPLEHQAMTNCTMMAVIPMQVNIDPDNEARLNFPGRAGGD